jgi:hypothetical protein
VNRVIAGTASAWQVPSLDAFAAGEEDPAAG